MLFFVGVEVVLMLSLHNFIHSTKENMTITAVLTEEADSTEVYVSPNFLASLLLRRTSVISTKTKHCSNIYRI